MVNDTELASQKARFCHADIPTNIYKLSEHKELWISNCVVD